MSATAKWAWAAAAWVLCAVIMWVIAIWDDSWKLGLTGFSALFIAAWCMFIAVIKDFS